MTHPTDKRVDIAEERTGRIEQQLEALQEAMV